MHQAVQAYSQTARTTRNPRELEADLLIRAAARLQSVKDNWDGEAEPLHAALFYNRKLWSVLVTSATRADNPLPPQIKQNIANLGLFIFNRTLDVQMRPEPAKLDVLVTINREIAAGLSFAP